MKTETLLFRPKARSQDVIVKAVDGELLIYDRDRDRAHCLNPLASSIWKLCDGRTTPRQIAAKLSGEIELQTKPSLGSSEQIVLLGLEELRRCHLLEQLDESPVSGRFKVMRSMTRREAIRRIGLGAAVALPIVATITAPTPAQAGTCKHANASCNTGGECCSGVCSGSPQKCLGG
jgi:hypothetical protein